MIKNIINIIIGFIILFGLYHGAEYMVMFKNSPLGFLGFQLLFFIGAWGIAKWQFKNGLQAWGLDTGKRFLQHLLMGMIMGVVLYGLTFIICVLTDIEHVIQIPPFSAAIGPFALFIFGNFFSSFSEDILTRGYVYKQLHGRVGNFLLLIISASVYLLNHIYRLTGGMETYLYLFMLGVLFIIPLILTKRLWFTGGMHWAGNCTFYLTHEIFKTVSDEKHISANYILVFCIIVLIPLNYWLLGKLKLTAPSFE